MYIAYRSHSGLPMRIATAATTSSVPIQPTMLRMFFTIALSLPPLGVDRSSGQEQAERDDTQVIDQVFRIEDPLREVVEVIRDREVIENRLRRRSDERRDPVDHP